MSGDALESVGAPNGEAEAELSDDGRIRVRGDHVALGLLTETGLAPLTDDAGWLTTNDLGEIREGLLYFKGRADDVVNIGGVKVSPEIFDERLGVRLGAKTGFASARMPDAARGEGIFVAALREANLDPARVRREAVRVAQSFGVNAQGAIRVGTVDTLPKTPTGKVQRAALAALYKPEATAAPAQSGAYAPLTRRETEIAAIWKTALKVDAVKASDSFFDMGGDSLSAINVIVRMEQMGVDPAVARQIFEGRTVAEIAATLEPGFIDDGAPPEKAAAARTADSLNVVRGLMVVALIAGHWLPFILERLPETDTLYRLTNPFLRLGTPGFAIVYGLGLGFYQYPLFLSNRKRFDENRRLSLAIVGAGVLLMGALDWAYRALTDAEFSAIWASELFFSVLLFYFFSIATLGLLFRLVALSRHTILSCLIIAAICILIEALFVRAWGTAQTAGVVDLARLMLVAKYNIFIMTATALFGMTMGSFIRDHVERPDLGGVFALAGAAMLVGGVGLSIATGIDEMWFSSLISPPPMVLAYGGLVALTFAGVHRLARRLPKPGRGLASAPLSGLSRARRDGPSLAAALCGT